MSKLRKGMAALLCALLLVGLLPTAAMAVGIQEDTPTFTLNDTSTVIHFAGHEWYVIGDSASGVKSPDADHITLLAKSSFGNVAYNSGGQAVYNGGGLHTAMTNAYDTIGSKEQALITSRTIDGLWDGSGGFNTDATLVDQKLWPLSITEYQAMSTLSGDAFSGYFWLRSPSHAYNASFGVPGGGNDYTYNVYIVHAVRPALHLNLASVIFTSDASEASGKSNATVGGGLVGAQALTGNLKFTFSDNSTAPSVTFAGTTGGTSTLRFGYSGATTGINQYLSCVLEQSGAVKYYAKLANCATDAGGVFSIDTSGLPAGAYDLKVFSEQANDNDHSDFASQSQNFTLTVDGSGKGTVTGGTPDNAAPTVSTVAPSGAAEPVSGNVVITFSEAMNPIPGVGEVKLNSGAALPGGSWTSATEYTVPYSGLAAGTTYTVNISGFQDANGNEMAADGSNSFTTAAGVPDPGPNPVPYSDSSTSPSYHDRTLTDPATGVSVSGRMTNSTTLLVKGNGLHSAGACSACDEIRARQAAGELIILYDISLSGDYTGSLAVSIPVGVQYNGQSVTILHCRNRVLESVNVTVSGGIAKGTFSSLSPFAVVRARSGAITGLPDAYTLLEGQSVSWTPAPAGGVWQVDSEYLTMTESGGRYTFTAEKLGKTVATYTVNGVSHSVQITINYPEVPQTGDKSDPLPFTLLALASLAGIGSVLLFRRKRRA